MGPFCSTNCWCCDKLDQFSDDLSIGTNYYFRKQPILVTVCLHHRSQMALACSGHRVLKWKPYPVSSASIVMKSLNGSKTSFLPSNDFIRNQDASKNNVGYSTSCADQEGNGPFDRFKDRRPFGYVKLLVDQVHPLLFCTVDEFIDDRFTAVFGTKFHRPFQGYIYIDISTC